MFSSLSPGGREGLSIADESGRRIFFFDALCVTGSSAHVSITRTMGSQGCSRVLILRQFLRNSGTEVCHRRAPKLLDGQPRDSSVSRDRSITMFSVTL